MAARDSTGKICFAAVRRMWLYSRMHRLLPHTTRLTKVALFFSDLDAILSDVLSMSESFRSISFNHVKRDENTVPHNLARVVQFGVKQHWENHCLRDVAPYVHFVS